MKQVVSQVSTIFDVPKLNIAASPNPNTLNNSGIGTGVELEVEGFVSPPSGYTGGYHGYWNKITDHSLKNAGKEFVLSHPLKGKKLEEAIKSVYNYLDVCEYHASLRTSTHIHLDCTKLKLSTVRSIVAIYLCFEKVLYNYCGKWRGQSIFCVPFYDSVTGVKMLAQQLYSKPNHIDVHECKYYGMNIHTLKKFGTLEYRMLPLQTDHEEVLNWINILYRIRQAGIRFAKTSQIQDIPSILSSVGAISFLDNIFKNNSGLLKDKYEDQDKLEEDIISGVRVTQDFLYTYI